MRTMSWMALAICAALIGGCGGGGGSGPPPSPPPPPVSPPPPPPPPPAQPTGFRVTELAAGLDNPWSIAFLPDGSALLTERDGPRLRRLTAAGALDPTAVAGLPAVFVNGQGGLLDIAVDPDYARTGLVFLSYAQGNGAGSRTAVSRAVLTPQGLTQVQEIFRSAPDTTDNRHYAGRLAFLADGTLLVTVGDRHQDQNVIDAGGGATQSPIGAQAPSSGLGKIHRIARDGSLPIGNPFANDPARTTQFSLGHRNPQGLVVDATNARIWETEHGPSGGDELNLITSGDNYGWPLVSSGIVSPAITVPSSAPGFVSPRLTWSPAIAPSGMALYTASVFPQWRGDLFVAALAGRKLVRIDLDAAGNVLGQEDLLAGRNERLRDVELGPDGLLYVLTDSDNGRIYRLDPTF